MRCFIAIDVSEQFYDYFKELQNNLKTNIKATFTKTFHLTLKFLGEIEENKVEKVKDSLKNIKFEPFKVSLSNLGVFPNENYIRVIWIGLEPKDKIIEFQQKIDNELISLKFKKEKKFHPHITLARVKHIEDKKEFITNLKQIKTQNLEFNINSFKLIKSTLTPEGPVYEDLGIY